jgi:hypothetical protein
MVQTAQEKTAKLNELVTQLFDKRTGFESLWQQTAELFYPERADFTGSTSPSTIISQLMDSSPVLYRRDFGNYLGSVLRPKARQWFKFVQKDRSKQVGVAAKQWLEHTTTKVYGFITDRRSQFINAMATADQDYAAFGNAPMSIDPRKDGKGFLFRTWHLRDCAWRYNPEGFMDCFARKFKLTARDAAKMPGWICSSELMLLLNGPNKQPLKEITFVHLVVPYDLQDCIEGRQPKGMEYCEFYIDMDHNHRCAEAPVRWMKYITSRWFTIDGCPYAYSPTAIVGSPDAMSAQEITRSILEAAEKAVEPPIVARKQAILGGVNLYGGGITWIDPGYDEKMGDALRPLDLGKHPAEGVSLRQDIRQTMMDIWYLNKLFLPPPDGAAMTASEVERRVQEWLRIAQPIIEPAEPERNGKVLDLLLDMALDLGMLGDIAEIPEELMGEDLDVEYENPITDMQRQLKVGLFSQAQEVVGIGAQTDPTVTKIIKMPVAVRDALHGANVPADWMTTEEEFDALVQESQEQQQLRDLAEQANTAAITAQNVGKAAQEVQAGGLMGDGTDAAAA